MSEYTPDTEEVRTFYAEGAVGLEGEFDRWLTQHDLEAVLDERDRVSNILSDRSKFWSNESKREDINLKQRERCEDRAEILSNAIALIVWINEGINNV